MFYIRSKIDYGSFLYGDAAKSVLKKVDVIHNAGLRIALHLKKNRKIFLKICPEIEILMGKQEKTWL